MCSDIQYQTPKPFDLCVVRNRTVLYMLLLSPEMHIQLMQMFQQGSEGGALGHLGEGVDVLGEALATITELTIRSRDIGVSVVDIT